MTDPVKRLADAEFEAAEARERLARTLAALQARLRPRRLARTAARDLAEAGNAAAKAGVETARRNPGALAGATALAGLFLARHRLVQLYRRVRGETRDGDAS